MEADPDVDKILGEAQTAVKSLEELEDYYFGADKGVKMKELATKAESLVDTVLQIPGNQPRERRIKSFYLKGRAASFIVGQETRAKELLSKAIKLDPQCVDAWNVLGEVHWNLQDFSEAQRCFEQAIEFCGSNSVSLRNLSMVLRAVDGDVSSSDAEKAERRARNYDKALEKAKEATTLEPKDAQNWETLGNAYFGCFFVTSKRLDDINRSLIAYSKAESFYDALGKHNPTLQLNRGRAAKYMEDYDLALRSFQKAHSIGAAGAAQEASQVMELVKKLYHSTERKGDLKARRIKELTSDILVNAHFQTLKDLKTGAKAGAVVAARAVLFIDREGQVPVIFICCDAMGEFFALSFYNSEPTFIAENISPMKSLLHIKNGKFRSVSVKSGTGEPLTYPSVRVAHPGDVTVVGAGSLGNAAVESLFSSGGGRVAASGPCKQSDDVTEPTKGQIAPEAAPATETKKGKKTKQVLEVDEAATPNNKKDETSKVAIAQVIEATTGEAASNHADTHNSGQKPVSDEVRNRVTQALLPGLKKLVEAQLGAKAACRIGRVEKMFQRIGQGDVHTENDPVLGERYAPGFIDNLSPKTTFHDPKDSPWCEELRKHWIEIRDELRSHLQESLWTPGAFANANEKYGADWRIAGVMTEDKWQHENRWAATQRIVQKLSGVKPFEVFFARMPPHTEIAPHSDNLNYILTSHLALELEEGQCSIHVGKQQREWKEGEMLVFDTTYMHSAQNKSDRYRYVLVLRFWHPGLTEEEQLAIHLSHALLAAAAADPTKQ